MKKIMILTAFLLMIGNVTAQNEHFLVEFDAFSPPTQDLVKHFEGTKATAFMAPDITGKQQNISDYKGKKTIIWFWSIANEQAQRQVGPLELLQESDPNVRILTFASEQKDEMIDYKKKTDLKLTVIPNGDVFGEMAYGSELGTPRMFIINKDGIIEKVLPRESFQDNTKLYHSLTSILKGIK